MTVSISSSERVIPNLSLLLYTHKTHSISHEDCIWCWYEKLHAVSCSVYCKCSPMSKIETGACAWQWLRDHLYTCKLDKLKCLKNNPPKVAMSSLKPNSSNFRWVQSCVCQPREQKHIHSGLKPTWHIHSGMNQTSPTGCRHMCNIHIDVHNSKDISYYRLKLVGCCRGYLNSWLNSITKALPKRSLLRKLGENVSNWLKYFWTSLSFGRQSLPLPQKYIVSSISRTLKIYFCIYIVPGTVAACFTIIMQPMVLVKSALELKPVNTVSQLHVYSRT